MSEPPTKQLVCEFPVRDLERALTFYRQLGFSVLRSDHDFAVLLWEECELFLAVDAAIADNATNVRIMVDDVDARWQRVQQLGARIITPIRDAAYGLRDFTCCDPDGNRLRFASRLG